MRTLATPKASVQLTLRLSWAEEEKIAGLTLRASLQAGGTRSTTVKVVLAVALMFLCLLVSFASTTRV